MVVVEGEEEEGIVYQSTLDSKLVLVVLSVVVVGEEEEVGILDQWNQGNKLVLAVAREADI